MINTKLQGKVTSGEKGMRQEHAGASNHIRHVVLASKTLTKANMLRFNKTGKQVHGDKLVCTLVSTFKVFYNKNIKTNEMWHKKEHSKSK